MTRVWVAFAAGLVLSPLFRMDVNKVLYRGEGAGMRRGEHTRSHIFR